MLKHQHFLSCFARDTDGIPHTPTRSSGGRIAAMVIAFAVVGLAAISGMKLDPANSQGSGAPQTAESSTASAEFADFP